MQGIAADLMTDIALLRSELDQDKKEREMINRVAKRKSRCNKEIDDLASARDGRLEARN
jgi:hypothetical protein